MKQARSDLVAQAFAPAFLRKLERLHVSVPRSRSNRPGNTPVAHGTQATGLELSRHRPYVAGDDLRHLDWNVYGRLDQLFVKRFRAEREAPLHVLIDTSASMAAPQRDDKLGFARAVAAALAYVSLRDHDPVRVVALDDGARGFHESPLLRHPHRFPMLRGFLEPVEARGAPDIAECVAEYLRSTRVVGMAVLISDFLTPRAHGTEALRPLRLCGGTVVAIRPLGAAERELRGFPARVRLRDSESGRERSVHLTRDHAERYRRALRAHLDGWREWCKKNGVTNVVVDPENGLEDCVLRELPRAGVLR